MTSDSETLMESVTCSCGNHLLMSSECDFSDIDTDTWSFTIRIKCGDPLNTCCKEKIQEGLDSVCMGMQLLHREIGKNFEIYVELPGNDEDEEE